MKKSLISVHTLTVLVLTGFARVRLWGDAAGAPEPQEATAEPVVFELHCRALDAPDGPLSYRSFWGLGGSPPADVPLVEAIKEQVGEFDPACTTSP